MRVQIPPDALCERYLKGIRFKYLFFLVGIRGGHFHGGDITVKAKPRKRACCMLGHLAHELRNPWAEWL